MSHPLLQRLRAFCRRGAAPAASHPFDRATGMDTGGLVPTHPVFQHGGSYGDESQPYYATAPSLFHALLARWAEDPARYTFVDIGCGKGRVLLLASEFRFEMCIGVELCAELAAVAEANLRRWRRAVSPVWLVRGDALDFEWPAGPCVAYLFNPFGAPVLHQLLNRMAAAFASRPGELDLLYINAEGCRELEGQPGWQRLWTMPVTMSPEDAAADLLYQADAEGRKLYGEPAADACSAWRWIGLG